jgi:hypothetical protein
MRTPEDDPEDATATNADGAQDTADADGDHRGNKLLASSPVAISWPDDEDQECPAEPAAGDPVTC